MSSVDCRFWSAMRCAVTTLTACGVSRMLSGRPVALAATGAWSLPEPSVLPSPSPSTVMAPSTVSVAGPVVSWAAAPPAAASTSAVTDTARRR